VSILLAYGTKSVTIAQETAELWFKTTGMFLWLTVYKNTLARADNETLCCAFWHSASKRTSTLSSEIENVFL